MLFADFPIANRCKIWYIKGKWFGFGLLYCIKSSTLWGAALFVLHGFYGAVKERIRTARAPRLASAGQKRPGGTFLGRGLANPFGHTKKRIAMYFCNAFFPDFRIILVAYHLPHQCIALLPVDHFSTDLWCFA